MGTDFEVIEPAAPQFDVIEPQRPSWAQVLGGTWQQPGLGIVQAVGGMARGAGDLTGFRTLQDWGAEVARNAKGARGELLPNGMSFGQEAVSGAIGSVGTMLPWMFAGGPVPGIIAAGTQTAAERYSGLRDYGFSGGKAAFHSAIDGLAEAAGERISLPVLWNSAGKTLLKQGLEFLTKDLAGEELTALVQGVNAKFADQPDKTFQSFLEDALMTAAVTPLAAGMQLGVARGAQAIMPGRQELPLQELVAPPEAVPPAAPPIQEPVTPPAPVAEEPPAQEGPPIVEETPPGPMQEEASPMPPEEAPPGEPSPVWMPDSRSAPPNEQLQGGRIDLRLYGYQGVTVDADSQGIGVGHYEDPINSRGKWISTVFEDYDQAADYLAKVRGYDLRERPDLLNTRWTDFVMKKLMQRSDAGYESLSGSSLQYIEGLGLRPVMQSLLTQRSLFEDGLVKSGLSYQNYNLENDTNTWWTLTSDKRQEHVQDFLQSADTVRIISSDKSLLAKQLQKRLEGWTKLFGTQTKFVIETVEGQGFNGAAFPNIVQGITKIQVDKHARNPEVTLAHEFGHALAFDTMLKADPQLQLKIMKDWAEGLSKLEKRPGLAALLGINGVNRIVGEYGRGSLRYDSVAADPTSTTPDDAAYVLQRGGEHAQYLASFQEHLADQVAQYLFDNKMLYTAEERSLFQEIADMLQNFYKTVVQKFLPNSTFYEYLDTLRGNAAFVRDPDLNDTPELPKEPMEGQPGKEPEKKKRKKKAPKVVEENGIDPKHREYAEKQRNKMLAALKNAVDEDTYDNILEEIDPTGLVDNFNFDRAQELLEMQGIPPEAFMSKTALMDDTFLLRAQSLKLQDAFPDLKRDFTKSREATKRFGGFLRKMLTAVQIRKRYGSEVPPIEQGVNAIERMEAYKARARTRADDRVKQMKAVGKDQRNKVFKFMADEDRTGNWMSEAVPNTTDGSRKLSPDVAQRYGITEEGALLYADLRKDFWDVLKELESLAIAAMARNVNRDDPLSVAQYQRNVQALQEQTAEQLARPYVPHTRFGDFYVQVSSETGKVQEFYQFESKKDAQKWATKLRDEGKNASAGVLREDIKTFAGLPPSLIQSMKGSLDLTDEQMRAFEDILKNMSGGQSFVRKMKKRKDIPGWADDEQIFPRVYADYMTKYANHAGRLKFSEELKSSEISLKQMIRDEGTSGRDTTNLGALLNWLQETNRYAMNPTSEWANIRGAVTLWYLGFSVKSAAVNALSVPMVTYPYLAQRFSDVQAVAAISRAYKDLSMKFHKPGILTDDELKFMEDMRQQNILDESYSSELAGIREGGTLADTMDVTPQGAVSIAKYYGMWMFHKMEGVNRQATALAAYRLARTQTSFDPMALDGFDAKAADFAKKTVQDTQNVNAQWNRSEFMRGGKSVLTMFMSYQQNLIFQMFGGDASWMRLLAVQLLVAGMMGLPFAKDADNLIKWFSRKVFDTDASAEKAIREWLSGFMDNPDWVLTGGSYNIFGSNLQGSLGMGQIIPGLDALAMEGSFPERLANAAPDIGGPAAAAALSFMQAMSSNDPDAINRFNRTLPAFAKQMSQGWTMFNEGVAKNSMGDPIAEASKKDAMMKMLGFQSTEVSKESAKRFAQKDTARFWLAERQYVLQMYYMASKPGNREFREKAREALRDYNQRVPSASLKIGADDIEEGINSRTNSDEKDARGAPRNARDYQLYKEISRRY